MFKRKFEMSQPMIGVKPEDLNTPEKREKYMTCIVGCGHDGILHAVLFADLGFRVTCFDSDQTVLNNVNKGKTLSSGSEVEIKLKNHVRTGRIVTINDIKKAVSSSDIIALTIPAKIDSKGGVDYSSIASMCKKIGSNLRLGSLIMIVKPVGTGVTEGIVKEAIEDSSGFKAGADFGLIYSPSSVSSGYVRIVAATDEKSLSLSVAILESSSPTGLIATRNVKAAELAILSRVQKDDVDRALTNELAMLCEKTCADYLEVIDLLKRSTTSLPSSNALSSEDSREEPYLLLAEAENLNIRLRVSAAARETNEQMVKHMVTLTKDALRSCGKTLRRARITLLGVSKTPNMKNHPKRMVKDLIQSLAARGARISVYDPYLSESDVSDTIPNFKKNLSDSIEGADCIVIVTPHDQFKKLSLSKLKMATRKPAAIVDLEGAMDPGKVEREGFIYRGLGRGVWTK